MLCCSAAGYPALPVWCPGPLSVPLHHPERPAETVYFNESCEEARTAVSDVLEAYNALLGKLSADERGKLQRCEGGQQGWSGRIKPGRLSTDERGMRLRQCAGGVSNAWQQRKFRVVWMDHRTPLPRDLCFLCAGQWG